jgi:hypothetical protein
LCDPVNAAEKVGNVHVDGARAFVKNTPFRRAKPYSAGVSFSSNASARHASSVITTTSGSSVGVGRARFLFQP